MGAGSSASTVSLSAEDVRGLLAAHPRTLVVARPLPPQTHGALTVVKSDPKALVSEGFMCPICMKNQDSMDTLVDHFHTWHPELSDHLPSPPPTPQNTRTEGDGQPGAVLQPRARSSNASRRSRVGVTQQPVWKQRFVGVAERWC
eukprot:m.1537566 g.1537566  ORF g.1537566 m.1537566 type:complete len:145 (-) comp25245_c0_seq32:8257-8691(-)